ncbi:MAG: ferredoxin [Candidatus Pacebacteria bacterium]|nr:ferredoxin [Candidatus Paceibacterota bacterium]
MKITLEREKCIGCGSCVSVCGKFFEMADDGKSTIKGAKTGQGGNLELETNEAECAKDAADICPVQIIHIN